MALQQVDTNEGVGEEDDIDLWLQKNKLMNARPKLIENDATLSELRELADESSINQLKEYAENELDLDLLTTKRFVKCMTALSATNMKPKQSSQNNSFRALITQKEEDALSNIIQRRANIKSKINESLNNINTLKQASTSNTDQLNQFRKDIMFQINQRIDELIIKSNKIIDQKKQIIGDHIKTLQNMDKSLNLIDSKCNQFLDDTSIDIKKRQNKIVDLVQNAVNSHKIEDIDITPKVSIKLDQNQMIEFVNNMIDVDDHDIPLTPDISIFDVKQSSVTVEINNMKIWWECSLAISTNYDERKDDNKWNYLCSIRNVDKYRINVLDNGTNYGLSARFKNNRNKYGEWCKPILFKTSSTVSKTIKYSVYGYIRRCQASNRSSYYNITHHIYNLIILYYDNTECFDVNNDTIFNYKYNEYGNRYHIFGTKQINRECLDKYKWIIETNQCYKGVVGIVDDTNNASNQFKQGTYIYNNKDVVMVGTKSGNAGGYKFGTRDHNLRSFIEKGDVITIMLDYINDTICFESKKGKKKVVRKLRSNVQTVTFIAEFYDYDATIKLLRNK